MLLNYVIRHTYNIYSTFSLILLFIRQEAAWYKSNLKTMFSFASTLAFLYLCRKK